MGWINIFGAIIVLMLLIPNIVWTAKGSLPENRYRNKTIAVIEQIGRYGAMFLMVFNIGLAEFGFYSKNAFLVYLAGNAVLILVYWIVWILYMKHAQAGYALTLAIVPSLIFLLSGILQLHLLLTAFASIFAFAHIRITWGNSRYTRH